MATPSGPTPPSDDEIDLAELFGESAGPPSLTRLPAAGDSAVPVGDAPASNPALPASGWLGPPAAAAPQEPDESDIFSPDRRGGGHRPEGGGSEVLRVNAGPTPSSSNIFDAPPAGSSRFRNPTDLTDHDLGDVLPLAPGSRAGAADPFDQPPSELFADPGSPSEADFELSSRAANDLLDDLGPRSDWTTLGPAGSDLFADDPADARRPSQDSGVDLLRPDGGPEPAGSFAGPGSSIFHGPPPLGTADTDREGLPRSAADDSDDSPDIFGGPRSGRGRPGESTTIDWAADADEDEVLSQRLTEAEANDLGVPDLNALTGGSADDDILITAAPTARASRARPVAPAGRARPATTTTRRPDADPERPPVRVPARPLAAGLVAGVLASAVVYFLALRTPEAAAPARSPSAPAARSVETALAEARVLLAAGEPERALPGLEAAGDAAEVRADRGKARLQARVRELARVGRLAANGDAGLKQAEEDLSAAVAAANTITTDAGRRSAVDAALHLGVARELVGDRAGAARAYEAGAKAFPAARVVFDTALTRLKLTAPAGARNLAPRAALDLVQAAAVTLVLLAPPDESAAEPKPLPAEAGFEFWAAANYAAANDYPAARAAIQRAKAAHDARRLLLAGRGLNPQSDPLEQVFSRCCDDLAAYWTLKQDAYTHPAAGPLIAKVGVKRALDQLAAAPKATAAEVAQVRKEAAAKEVTQQAVIADLGMNLKLVRDAADKSKAQAADVAKALAMAEKALADETAKRTAAAADAAAAATKLREATGAVATLTAEVKALQGRPPGVEPKMPADGDAAKALAQARAELTAAKQAVRDAEAAAKTAADGQAVMAARVAALTAEADKQQAARADADKQLTAATQARTELATRLADADAEKQTLIRQKQDAERSAAAEKARADAAVAGRPAPAPAAGSNPESAAVRYNAGVEFYFAGGRMTEAERAFADATQLDGTDARQWYFLGLARHGLGLDAAAAFRRGAELERQNRPGPRAVGAAFERVQGEARRAMEKYRE